MIPLPNPTKILESKHNKGTLEIEALYPGYGVTIGNSLRRVLLSSLQGAAITEVKIKGVNHEFSTIPGVLEDVLSILLNLKQLRFKMYADEPQQASLKLKGEKEVKGSDFKVPTQLEVINTDLALAHLTSKTAELEMEIQVEKGIGYVPAEQRKREKQAIGTIALDAIFTPVKRVSLKVENMRVGERTDFDRVIVEIETDGTMTPEEAFYQASDILVKQFEMVGAGVKEAAQTKEKREVQKTTGKKPKKSKGKKKKPAKTAKSKKK